MKVDEEKVTPMASGGAVETSSRGAELYIKPEFLVKVESAETEPKTKDVEMNEKEEEDMNKGDGEAKSAREKKKKGRNKNRPPPMKFSRLEKLCPVLINVSEDEELPSCTFPNCSYQHDLGEFLKNKPDDLSDTCPTFRNYGR